MSDDCNNDANTCQANNGKCRIPATYGVLCHRHARMVCSKAGNLFAFQKVLKTTLRGVDIDDIYSSVKMYLESDKAVDRPKKPIAFSEAVYERMKGMGWVPIGTIAEWLTLWTNSEVTTRQAGQAIRILNAKGLIERKMIGRDGAVMTMWRVVRNNDANTTE
tara:strand:+ start:57 stop:542 length:486 start_codon:yes stop_codon:yes gene_type:complete